MSDTQPRRKKVTIRELQRKMRDDEQIVQMAIYDYRSAVIADRLDIDILCVSDTGGMILSGHQSTVTVSFDEVMMMAKAIDRGSNYGLRMVDMPYWSFHVSPEQAVENAGRFVHEANAEVMKCEGNQHHAKNIEAIVKAGIPVQGHIGITPMRMPQLGGFFAQGKNSDRAKELVDDAWAMVDAGCFSIMCAVTSEEVCAYLTETLPVPVESFFDLLGGTFVPCALFSAGLFLTHHTVSKEFSKVSWMIVLKLLVHPMLTWLLAYHVFELNPVYAAVAVIQAALPVGVPVFVLAQHYNEFVEGASTVIVLSTIFSVVTISGWLLVIGV